jgi:UDP-N-acetylmuramate dehydrogenase
MMIARTVPALPFDDTGLRGTLKINEPMARHTSWRVGGAADYFYIPADRDDVVHLIRQLPREMPVTWVGLGSNLLVRDGGVEGVVIRTSGALTQIEPCGQGLLYAESGVSSARVARISVVSGLAGAEFLAGVPGSFGGALAMNAGAFGGETWPLVERIDCIDRLGNCVTFSRQEISFGYRKVELPEHHAVLAGVLKLAPAESATNGRQQIRSLLEKRSASQPIQSANAGSVFKNPPGEFAARIIQQLGLKGHSRGGARFSEVHANFIVNDGTSSAFEIESLINLARSQAMSRMNIQLEPEVRIIGRQA